MTPRRRPISAPTFVAILLVASLVGTGVGWLVSRWRDDDGATDATTTTGRLDPDTPSTPEALWLFGSETLRLQVDDLLTPWPVPLEVRGGVDGVAGRVVFSSPFSGAFGVVDATENRISVQGVVEPSGPVDPLVLPVVAAGEGSAWVVTGPAQVASVAIASGEERARVDLPASFTGVADGTAVRSTRVVAARGAGVAVCEIDTADGQTAVGLARVAPDGTVETLASLSERGPEGVAAVAGSDETVWVVRAETAVALDAGTLAPLRSVDLGARDGAAVDPVAAAAIEGGVAVLDRSGRLLVVSDTGNVGEIALGRAGEELEAVPGGVVAGAARVYTLTSRPDGSVVLGAVDPAGGVVERRLGLPADLAIAALAFSAPIE